MLAMVSALYQRLFTDFTMQIIAKTARTLRLNARDNVVVAVDVLEPGRRSRA